MLSFVVGGGINVEEHDYDQERKHDDRGRTEDVGAKGGAAEAMAMPVAATAVTAAGIGRVRWGAVWAGFIVTISLTLLLTTLGIGLGLTMVPTGHTGGLAYWILASTIVSLFIGAVLTSKLGGVRTVGAGIVHGVLVWGLLVLLDAVAGGMARGAAGFAGMLVVTGPEMGERAMMTRIAGWWFFVGGLVTLISAMLGGAAGVSADRNE
jgi:hypothetical protein